MAIEAGDRRGRCGATSATCRPTCSARTRPTAASASGATRSSLSRATPFSSRLDAKTGNEVWTATMRGLSQGLLREPRAAGRRRQGHGRHLGRRARHARLCRGLQRRERQGTVAHLHGPGARRAGLGDLAGRRCLEDRRRLDLDHRAIRPRERSSIYWGIGNGGPWMGDQRPGDNLYVDFGRRARPRDGAIKGHFQYSQNKSWDWDEVAAPILVDIPKDGETVPGLVHAARSGVLWELERTPEGPINFVKGEPFVKENWIENMDPKTGRITVAAGKKPGTGVLGDFCPSFWGGKDWPPISYDPDLNYVFIPANENLCSEAAGRRGRVHPGRRLHPRHPGRDPRDLHGRRRRSYRRSPGLGSDLRARRSGPTPSRTRRTGDR